MFASYRARPAGAICSRPLERLTASLDYGQAGEALMRALILGAVLAALAGPASAADLLLGVYGHDVTFIGDTLGLGAAGREDGADFQVGLRSWRIEGPS